MRCEELNNKFWNVELCLKERQTKEIMLLLLYPKLSSLINDRSIIFNISRQVRFSNTYNESFQFNDVMNLCLRHYFMH